MKALVGRRIAHMVGHWNTFLIGQQEQSIAVVDNSQIDVGGLRPPTILSPPCNCCCRSLKNEHTTFAYYSRRGSVRSRKLGLKGVNWRSNCAMIWTHT